MHRISAGLATCLVAAVTVGCGTVTASVSGHPGQRSGAPAATPATPARARVPSGCQAKAPRITQADNAKTFCVRVGATVTVLLRSSDFSIWLQPLASSGALRPVPGGEASLVKGVTAAWFAAVRPGQVLVTSVRPPCQVAISGAKGGLEPAEPVPTSYPLRFCPPGQRFSVAITVVG
jgi:hypothetical protein